MITRFIDVAGEQLIKVIACANNQIEIHVFGNEEGTGVVLGINEVDELIKILGETRTDIV